MRQELVQVYPLKEVIQMLKVSDDTIVEAIEKGQLKPLKIGVQWRIDRE